MKWRRQVTSIPEGDPIVGLAVAVRKVADRSTIMAPITDAQGYVEVAASGHLEPIYMHLADVPGGDKFLRSDEIHLAGTACMPEIPAVLSTKGDQVIKGALSEFSMTLTGGTTLTVAPGAAMVGGYPYVSYAPVTLTPVRPNSGTVTKQVILRVRKAPTSGAGEAFMLIQNGSVPQQDAGIWEMSLYTLTVPNAGNITWTDDRYLDVISAPASVTKQVSLAGTNTTSASGGPLPSMPVLSLVLPEARTYDITARLRAIQVAVNPVSSTARTITTTAANGLNYVSPGQIAVDGGGFVYVADTGNNRVLRLHPNGTYFSQLALRAVTGVAVDPSGFVYVAYIGTDSTGGSGGGGGGTGGGGGGGALPIGGGSVPTGYIGKYSYDMSRFYWTATFQAHPHHLTTDGIYVWATIPASGTITKRRCSDGVLVQTIGAPGSGPGQFNNPLGLSTNVSISMLYVVDQANNRVQALVYNTGVYSHEFPVPAGTEDLWVNESRSMLWLSCRSINELRRYSIHGGTPNTYLLEQTIVETAPVGVAQTTGGLLWVSAAAQQVNAWSAFSTPGGYGELAIDIGGVTSPYLGPGYREEAMSNVATAAITGPATVPITAYGKATAYQMSLQSLSMSAVARPRG